MTIDAPDEISLPQAAQLLHLARRPTEVLMLKGLIGPARQISGRWVLSAASVRAYAAARSDPARARPQTAA